jgi:DNA-binding transcriptional ArsR family regulator
MKYGPNISRTAALIGDPARANMVMALMSGMALTASELAREAGVTPGTASSHLSKLTSAGLLKRTKQGRHHYFQIADPDVADVVEALVTISTRVGDLRVRPGPKDQEMRRARSCYDHLAGNLAVGLFDHWTRTNIIAKRDESVELTDGGRDFLVERGVDIASLTRAKRPLCRSCLDWSERRSHLGGSIGAAVLATVIERGWGRRAGNARTISFDSGGEAKFISWYSL